MHQCQCNHLLQYTLLSRQAIGAHLGSRHHEQMKDESALGLTSQSSHVSFCNILHQNLHTCTHHHGNCNNLLVCAHLNANTASVRNSKNERMCNCVGNADSGSNRCLCGRFRYTQHLSGHRFLNIVRLTHWFRRFKWAHPPNCGGFRSRLLVLY